MATIKKITLRGLCDYMTAAPKKQRTIIHQFKYPTDDDAHAKIIYYREAKSIISAYHRKKESAFWLLTQAINLKSLAEDNTGQTRVRLNHNARALRSYATHFAARQFEVQQDVQLRLQLNDVVLNTSPDLHVIEKNKAKIIKFDFSTQPPEDKQIKIASQILFQAAQAAGMNLQSSCVLYTDVERGIEHRGARLGARMRSDIEAACLNLSSIWDSV